MTDTTTSPGPGTGRGPSVDVVREQAGNVAGTATSAGGDVLQSAKEQGRQVADEARHQARDLYGEARQQLHGQAGHQQERAAGSLRRLSEELRAMADKSGQSGPATELARQASGRVEGVASWLENREPGEMIDEVRGYARRHPGTFLAGAALLGVLAGRLTRGTVAASTSDTPTRTGTDTGTDSASGAAAPAPSAPTAVGTAPAPTVTAPPYAVGSAQTPGATVGYAVGTAHARTAAPPLDSTIAFPGTPIEPDPYGVPRGQARS